MSDLVHLIASDGLAGPEMVETSLPDHMLRVLARIAPRVRAELSKRDQLHDCWHAVSAWAQMLTASKLHARIISEADPDDQPRADFSRMTDAERGGYDINGGTVVRHAWLALEPDLILFDPTARQFAHRRGDIRRYWCQNPGTRVSFTEWRERERGALA